jgi:butyrate kinase
MILLNKIERRAKEDNMEKAYSILVINPGSTSTKIAVFKNEEEIFTKVISHSTDQIKKFNRIYEQYDFRKNIILETLKEEGIPLETLDAVVGSAEI